VVSWWDLAPLAPTKHLDTRAGTAVVYLPP
jgi:hypothetical protein